MSLRWICGFLTAAVFAAYVMRASSEEKPAIPGPTANTSIPAGIGQQAADLEGVSLEVFTYQPAGCTVSGALLVFHGLERNAEAYRDYAIPLGQRMCVLVVAPLFDKTRFPTWRYQRGGIVGDDGSVQTPESWTVNLVPRLVSWIRHKQSRADLPYSLIGHSAGAQFLSRVAAYAGYGATQTVIANPSTWVRPSLDIAAPTGSRAYLTALGARRRFDAISRRRSQSCSVRRTSGRVILPQVRKPKSRAVRASNAVRMCFKRRTRRRAAMGGHSTGAWPSFQV
jgi:hypothetical protein